MSNTRATAADSSAAARDARGPGAGGERAVLTRRYRFSAAHRLHRAEWSDERNAAVFGKCANPRGHGHNYVLWISVGGDIDPVTGFVVDLGRLDAVVGREVISRWDHRDLNHDAEGLTERVPTGETLVRRVWELLEPALPPGTLRRVRLQETRNNCFELAGALRDLPGAATGGRADGGSDG